MICKKCSSPMVIVSSGRGLKTFACANGCECYDSVEIDDLSKPETEEDHAGG